MNYQNFVDNIKNDIEKAGRPLLVFCDELTRIFPQNKSLKSIAGILRDRYGLKVVHKKINGYRCYEFDIKEDENYCLRLEIKSLQSRLQEAETKLELELKYNNLFRPVAYIILIGLSLIIYNYDR